MEIKNCTIDDIDKIFKLYELATNFQKSKKKVVVWPKFKKELIEIDIAEKRQWKIVANGEIMCVWTITFSDKQIWEEKNIDKAIYIHRIATNPNFRGNSFIEIILKWAKDYAKLMNKDFIRLDTIGNNIKLIEYYKKSGFDFLGMFELKNTDTLPKHYHNASACLFEIKLNN